MAEDDLQRPAPQGQEQETNQEHEGPSSGPAASRPKAGLGFRALAMNEIAAPKTEETGEVVRRAGNRWLILIGVLLAAALLYLGGRTVINLPPGAEAETRLRARLMTLESWRNSVVRGARYLSGNTLRLNLSTQLSTGDRQARDTLREAARQVMDVLIQERPGRDLRIIGFQGEEEVLWAEYRQKSSLAGPGGEAVPEILVRVKGDPASLAEEAGTAAPKGE